MIGSRTRRLLTVGHSYVVQLNRRLAHEMSLASDGKWDVTAAAPCSFPGDLRRIDLTQAVDEACDIEPLPLHFARSVHLMIYGSRLRQILREPWDLVHAWEEPFIFAGGQIAYHTPRNVPFVFSTFQNISKRYPPPFSWIEHYTVNRAAGWIAFGHSVQAALEPTGAYDSVRHRVITPGVDVDHFRPDAGSGCAVKQRLGWTADGPPVVGYLGRFVQEKGIPVLLNLLERVQAPWRALFVGGGPLEGRLREWATRQGDRVRICTGVDHADVPSYLNAMDMLCAPSQTTSRWREQFGRMLIEGFACGVPVIASDSGEIPYVVGDAGVLLREHDLDQWVKAVEELLGSPRRRRELGEAGRERAVGCFAWRVIASKHLAFFDEILESTLARSL